MKGDPGRDEQWRHRESGELFLVMCVATNPINGERIVVYRPPLVGGDHFGHYRPAREFRQQFKKVQEKTT